MKRKILTLTFLVWFSLVVIVFPSCASFGSTTESVIHEHEDRMHWEITSPTGTSVHILGTIHVGKEDTFLMDKELLQTFLQADICYGELSTFDLAKMSGEPYFSFLENSLIRDDKGSVVPITDFLTQEETNLIRTILNLVLPTGTTEEEIITTLFMPPWYWINLLEQLIWQFCDYTPTTGVDFYLYDVAAKNNMVVLGLDFLETQLNFLSYGSPEDQVLILKNKIASLLELETNKKELDDLYNAYEQNDKEKLASYLNTDFPAIEGLSQGYIMGYWENLLIKRNRDWAEQITEMLNQENKTFFIFAGAAHWLCEPSVFAFLVNQKVAVWE